MKIARALLPAFVVATLALSPAGAHWLGEKGKEGKGHEGNHKGEAEGGEQKPVEEITDEEKARAYFTDLTLLDQEGREVRFYSDVLKDRVVLITFFYTDCGDACPLVMEKLKEVEAVIGTRMGEDIFFILISVDPKNDTVEAIDKYREQYGVDDGWIFLTGRKKNLDQITYKLGQYKPTREEHSTTLLLGNVREKRWAKVVPTLPSIAISTKLREMAGETGKSGVE
ncbi:MAG: SCO family protein [Deltaproteobacteria bacterium]|nr:SCO family protein [Deltaproteobacteria bacterium]